MTINFLLSKSLYLLGGFPPTWCYQHNLLHHGFTNVDGKDEDIDRISFLRFSPHRPLFKIHRLQQFYAWFFYGLMTISWSTRKDFKQVLAYKREGVVLDKSKSYKYMIVDLIVSKIIYYAIFLVIPILVLPISWAWILLFYFMRHFISGFILSAIFQTAHVVPSSEYPLLDSKGQMKFNWAIHQLHTTANCS
jgi:linoleoyl-CoA desaturase